MDEDLHNIEDLFYSELDQNSEQAPPKNLWDKIDKQLDKDNITSIKRGYTGLKWVTILLLFLLGVTLYKLNIASTNTYASPEKTSHPISKNQKETEVKTEKVSNEEYDTKPTTPGRIAGTANNKNCALASNSMVNEAQLIDLPRLTPAKGDQFRKQNTFEKKNNEKHISQKQFLFNDQQTITSPRYNLNIKTGNPAAGEQPMAVYAEEQKGHIISFPEKIKGNPVENLELHRSYSIASTQLPQIDASSGTKIIKANDTAATNNSLQNKIRKKQFFLTPFFSPDIAWYYLDNDKPANRQQNAKEIKSMEDHDFSYTLGLLVDCNLNKHWGLQSGITYANTNITVQPKTIYAQPDNTGDIKYMIITSSGYGYVLPSFSNRPAIGDSLYAFTVNHSLQYISIPLAVTYHVTMGKYKLNALAGISTNILMKASLEAYVENGTRNSEEAVDKLQGVKKANFSGLTGIGVDYMLTQKTALTFAPVLRFALNSINKDAIVKSYPMSMGFAVGLKVGL